MLTKKDIRDLLSAFKEVFLTKDDAKAFLTKDDAKAFLTKEDAKNFLTKEDAKSLFQTKHEAKALLTKNDAKSLFQTKQDAQTNHEQIILKLTAIESRVTSLEGNMKALHDFIVPALGNLHEWTDEIHNEVVREKLLTRVKRVEKQLGILPLV